jgi:hypothetical protein
MIGSVIPISALLFCLAIALTQAWLFHRRFDRATYSWIGMSILGLIVAVLCAIATGFLLLFLVRLDVLQNSQHGAIVSVAMMMVFGIVMVLSQLR